ncbi:hypothetical protein LCGC14_1410430 [marine sediment metagenome]|uniref:Uncharacterized protein n=1 Tax=marine sediment metagenome TaxID=412755 RepID=A0A0F9M9U3_9ZZZZ
MNVLLRNVGQNRLMDAVISNRVEGGFVRRRGGALQRTGLVRAQSAR